MNRVMSLVGWAVTLGLSACIESSIPPDPGPGRNLYDSALVMNARTMPDGTSGQNDALNMFTLDRVDSDGDDIVVDIAFDINEAGVATVIGTDVLETTKQGEHESKVSFVNGDFDALTSAPDIGYQPGPIDMPPDRVVFTEVLRSNKCGPEQKAYGKIKVDSVNLVTRKIYVRAVANPYCGNKNVETPPPEEE